MSLDPVEIKLKIVWPMKEQDALERDGCPR